MPYMLKKISRRQALKIGGAAGAALAAPMIIPAHAASPRLVVVGGGAGGATVARHVAADSKGAVDVTLIEANKTYTTCFFSNWYLGGFRTMESITHGYGGLEKAGVTVMNQWATGIDPDGKTVTTADGSKVGYDRLVVAPGIDFKFDTIEGYDAGVAETIPHAYKAGPQTTILRNQLEAMEDGGTVVVAPPPNPFRCPPGPYERISLIAHYLKHNKPKSKIIVLDAKNKFSKQGLFQEAWATYYDGMIEWLPADMLGGGVNKVDAGAMSVSTADETFQGDVINVIPAQMSGKIARDTGLANDSGWCPVDPESFESQQIPNIHLVGDSIIPGDMPKSGFSANSQAKVCANAVRHLLTDSRLFPARFSNTCWSLVGTNDAVKVGASYNVGDGKIKKIEGFISKTGEDRDLRSQTADEAIGWYSGITADMFG